MKEKDISEFSQSDPFENGERDPFDLGKKCFSEHDEDDLPEYEEEDDDEEEEVEENEEDACEEIEVERTEEGKEEREEPEAEREEEKEEPEAIKERGEGIEKEEPESIDEKEEEVIEEAEVEEEEEEEVEYEEEEVEEVQEQEQLQPQVQFDEESDIEEEGPLKGIDLKREVERAERRIRKHIRQTPLEYSPFLSQEGHCEVHLKLENVQLTGSFKLRGTMNKLLSLSKKERRRVLVTASSGNHGAAFAYGLKKLKLKGIIYLPSYTSKAKLDSLKYYDVVTKMFGTDCVKTEIHAREEAEKNDFLYIPPYNDLKIIGGQGTVGIELRRQLEHLDVVLVPVGGGGLISGIAGYLKSLDENIEIVGCQPLNSAVMAESIHAGEIIEMESQPTLSDGSAGGIEQGSITFDICQKYVTDFILVSEEEIREAIKLVLDKHFMLLEGAGALTVASFMKAKESFEGKNVVLVLSGAKISTDVLKEVLS
jgi:threonine dehydratase